MLTVEFIYDHQYVDIAEGYEAEGKNAQGAHSFGSVSRLVGTKEAGNARRINPYHDASYSHRKCDKAKCLAQECVKACVIAFTHDDGTERLKGLARSAEEQVVDLQQVHAYGKGEDACAS